MSYADRLRRALLGAGIDRHELHHETATTLPVDFHSTRRAYAQALARIGLNAQQAAKLTGHSDLDTHQRYLESTALRILPAAAVPYVDPRSSALVANRSFEVAAKAWAKKHPGCGSRERCRPFANRGDCSRFRAPKRD